MKPPKFLLGFLSLWLGFYYCPAAVVQGDPVITERGPHHRVWSRQDVRTLPDGHSATNVSTFVELGSGIHRWNARAGQYVDASDVIEIAADGSGAFGHNAAHQVQFSPNANTAGAITLITPDGKTLKSHAMGLAWFDSATGQSELFASIKDSIGELHAPNVVIYPDAFDGGPGFRADIRYTHRLDGFSQDIVILTKPPQLPPGYAPDTTRMEVWTEIIEAPAALLTQEARAGMTDDTLNFGAMQIAPGRAFVLGEEANPKRSAPVAKRWLITEGRTFLVEAVRYLSVKPELDKLPVPKGQAALKPRNANTQLAANVGGGRPFPSPPPARAKNSADKFRTAVVASPRPPDVRGAGSERAATSVTNAALTIPSPLTGERTGARGNSQLSTVKTLNSSAGLVIDYDLVGSLTDFTLQCDTTYLVTNTVNFYGTTVFEGGCVVKFSKTNIAQLNLNGTNVWRTAQYRPTIFTAVDDHSIGTTIGSGTLSSNYGGAYLKFSGGGNLENARFSHARKAIQYSSHLTNRHVQFVHCSNALEQVTASTSMLIILENVLLYDIPRVFNGDGIFSGYHLTAHQCGAFMDGTSATFYNSLVLDAPSFGDTATTFNSSFQGSSSGIFQTVGAAAHYLAAGSPHRNAGTTIGISSTLLADLKKRTIFPPILLTGTLTSDLSLTPQAQRDSDTPDLGYHYDPLDFVCNSLQLNGKIVTASAGTALGVWSAIGTNAIELNEASQFISTGSPTNLNRLVRYNTVQEQANTNWAGFGETLYPFSNGGSGSPLASFRFNEWAIPGRRDVYYYNNEVFLDANLYLADSQVHGGALFTEVPILCISNCILDRASVGSYEELGFYAFLVNIRNSTFRGGEIIFAHSGVDAWTVRDSLFDNTAIYTNGTVSANWNAYTTNLTRLPPPGAKDVLLATNAIAYQTSWLGSFYLPDTGPGTNLFNKGSTNAHLLGLYHFTTTTNQVKETTTTNDIGFHYLAVGSNGLPVDSDNDGWPDYLEDTNGNGSLDHRETKTNDAADWGLRVFITRPRNGSSIP